MKEIPKLVNNHSHIPYSTQALSGDANNEASFVPIPGLDERCKWCLLRQERHENASDSNDSNDRVRAVVRFPKGSMERKSSIYYLFNQRVGGLYQINELMNSFFFSTTSPYSWS
jgi:hypothetical protein